MDLRRVVGLFGAMAASMAGTIEFMRILIPKIARWFVGDDDFCSVCMRHSLKVY
jgi:ABC-type Fe3+-siderophore transport system permease subunit